MAATTLPGGIVTLVKKQGPWAEQTREVGPWLENDGSQPVGLDPWWGGEPSDLFTGTVYQNPTYLMSTL